MSRVYFTDRDLGKQFPEILRTAGLAVERNHDLFPPDTPDEVWLEYCGRNDRIAISHDQNIRYRPNELGALIEHQVALLVMIGKKPYPALAQNFVNTLPKIEALLADAKRPFITKIYMPSPSDLVRNPAAPGSIALWYPQPK